MADAAYNTTRRGTKGEEDSGLMGLGAFSSYSHVIAMISSHQLNLFTEEGGRRPRGERDLAMTWRQRRPSRFHPTKHPGLKIPAGSNAALRRRISVSAPSLGVSKKLQLSADSRAGGDHAQIAARECATFAPSRDRISR